MIRLTRRVRVRTELAMLPPPTAQCPIVFGGLLVAEIGGFLLQLVEQWPVVTGVGVQSPGDDMHSEAAALKCVYLPVMRLDPTGKGRKRWKTCWKRALQAFNVAFDGRLSIAHN
ncbi:hypothetical protein ACFVGL_05320 [Streptomyces tubercidicus]|uniref:hypothetical protein n=1 Tax=Streptomyces tubercidicus TaxID=47759 RepID=UPI0036866028